MSNTAPPFIPDNAPFSTEQRAWLNGFLAGMFSSQAAGDAPAAQEVKPITLLVGSQTGTAEGLAKQTAKALKAVHYEPKIQDMGSYDPAQLSSEGEVLILTSTYGDGEPPDSAQALYDFIHAEGAPRLENLSYSVLALGDTSYPDFCKCGIDFDVRLEALGAKRFSPRVDCDVDVEEPFEEWKKAIIEVLSANSGGNAELPVEEEEPAGPSYDKKNPFPATLLTNVNLNGEGSAKEVRHFEFSLKDSGLNYEVGDALGVYPVNCPELVGDILKTIGFDGEEAITYEGEEISLWLALSEKYDIRALNKPLLIAYAAVAKNDKLESLLWDDAKALSDYMWGRELIDVLVDFPVKFETPAAFVGVLKKISPRLYSISSSPKAHPDEVHLTVGAVRYDAHGRPRKGICSTFLADRVGDSLVKIFFHANNAFRLPEDKGKPVIMVGPGTGIAPFRAFLEERQATEASGKNWLFFGDQCAATDFLYKEQLDAMAASGNLQRLDTAFSRDQEEKIYVQNRMKEHAAELYKWLEEGAYFYVCGDASRMAKDVDKALHEIVEEQGKLSADDAADYIKKLKSEKRYARDVY